MNRLRTIAVGLAVLIASACVSVSPGGPVVHTASGAVAGKTAGGVHTFRGIPYAEAPVGERRWKPPVSKAAWKGVLPATSFGPACVQPRPRAGSIYANPPEKISEDCLSLNVWSPHDADKAPVFVWIHGGSLTGGYNSEPLYDGTRLAKENGLVVVTINYRLGVLGYLAHPELSAESPEGISGNYGLMDQIEALHWVRKNIAAFGGDPENVTIAGESAGALSVMHLMAVPDARGLFHKAILQSAYMVSLPYLDEGRHGHFSSEQVGKYIETSVGAPDLAGLRNMDPEQLTLAVAKAGFVPWPTVDGKLLTDQIVDVFDNGAQAPVPVIAGFNSGEIRTLRFLAPPVPESAAVYEAEIRDRYGDIAEAFLTLYPPTDLEEAVLAAPRDSLYGWTASRLVRKQSELGQAAFLYYFDHTYPAASELGLPGFHAAEIPYVFGTARMTPPLWPTIPVTSEELALSDAMRTYWASFARDGVPSVPGGPVWKPFSPDKDHMLFRRQPTPGEDLLRGMYELHEEVVCRRRHDGSQPWNWNTGIVAPVLPPPAENCR